MRIVICDRCKAEMPKDIENAGCISLGWRDVRTGWVSEKEPLEHWDLCECCMKAISNFIRMSPPVKHSKPMAESLIQGSEPVEIRPEATVKKRVALDPEKVAIIRQMGDDGKSIKEIAAETGVSEPTVRKYLTA